MKKIIQRSPWGNYTTIEIGGKSYERSAQGGLWYCASKDVSFRYYCFLEALRAILPVAEVKEDTFTPILKKVRPEVKTDCWAER